MVPFSSQEDVDFFGHLELHLRQEHPPLAGRDHMAFRGSSYPVRLVQLLHDWKHCMHAAASEVSQLAGVLHMMLLMFQWCEGHSVT